ncbi:MAG: Maf family protein [Paracoccaceae bacterium]
MQTKKKQKIILGSSSSHRKKLLDKYLDNYHIIEPNIDESLEYFEFNSKYSEELAKIKSHKIRGKVSESLIITSDQIGVLDRKLLKKPLDHKNAIEQLLGYSNKQVTFYTSVCIFNQISHKEYIFTDETLIKFSNISYNLAEEYLTKDLPYNCCGSFKIEGRGLLLIDRIDTKDPTAVIGLPMIYILSILKELGHIIS